MAHLLFGKKKKTLYHSFFHLEIHSFDVHLCFNTTDKDKLAQNLIIVYSLTADYLSSIGRILSNINHLPTITNKQFLNTCEKQTFITKVRTPIGSIFEKKFDLL